MKFKTTLQSFISTSFAFLLLAIIIIFVMARLNGFSSSIYPNVNKTANNISPSLYKTPVKQNKAIAQDNNSKVVLNHNLVINSLAPETVISGGTITYTIILTNHSKTSTATDITLIDIPPDGVQDIYIHCNECTPITSAIIIPPGVGFPGETIYTVEEMSWNTFSLEPEESAIINFTVNISCKGDGTLLSNQAFVSYVIDGEPGTGIGPINQTTVLNPPKSSGVNGLSEVSAWCADEVRGVLDLDWGDFDQDGSLDLALASTGGTYVYHNNGDELKLLWNDLPTPPPWVNEHYPLSLSVQWADLIPSNDTLELIVVGDRITKTSPFTGGLSYIYALDNNGNSFKQVDVFTSALQLGYITAGDFNNDGLVDLIGATNFPAHNNLCIVSFFPNQNGNFTGPGHCLQYPPPTPSGPPYPGSTTLNAADYNNDGYLDLALGLFTEEGSSDKTLKARVLLNNKDGITASVESVLISTGHSSTPTDLAWGDFNRDGYLDLAEAVPRGSTGLHVRIYKNTPNGVSKFTLRQTITAPSVFALDWADFNGDGYLDLAIGTTPPKIYVYTNNNSDNPFSLLTTVPNSFNLTRIRRMRGADYDNDGDLDLGLTDSLEASLMFANATAFLAPTLTPIDSFKAKTVTWADVDADKDLDLIFGAGLLQHGGRLYKNISTTFTLEEIFTSSGFGPQDTVVADMDNDSYLDIIFAPPSELQIYNNRLNFNQDWQYTYNSTIYQVALADIDQDNKGYLDMLLAVNGRNIIIFNPYQTWPNNEVPVWLSPDSDFTQSAAWGYYNDDIFPDFAVGNKNEAARVYNSDNGQNFIRSWSADPAYNADTRSIVWGDYDGDGDLDLTLGNYDQPNYIYKNNNGQLGYTPVWSSPAEFIGSIIQERTTALAWGDWNSDGKLELAVGNYGQPDQIYTNLGTTDNPQLSLIWQSTEAYQTTDLAWGDVDGDGDLDLAISQDGDGENGFYENTYVLAAHWLSRFEYPKAMPLPNNPSYLSISRPGGTDNAYIQSTSEVIGSVVIDNLDVFSIPINFKVFDPDGSRSPSKKNAPGDSVKLIQQEFSLDGGSTWHPATGHSTYNGTTRRKGKQGIFYWQAGIDLQALNVAVSDNVKIRLTIMHKNKTSPVKKAISRAISPPFRVRTLTCAWPDIASITTTPIITRGTVLSYPAKIQFKGDVQETGGSTTYTWYFGDGQSDMGQSLEYTYLTPGPKQVKLIVTGDPCPTTRPAVALKTINITTISYLPLILKLTTTTTPTIKINPSLALETPLTLKETERGLSINNTQIITLTPSQDATLYEDETGNISNGKGQHLFVGRTSQISQSLRRSLLTFDIATNIPTDSTIISASLSLNLSRSAAEITQAITLYHVLNHWGEGSTDAPGSEGQGSLATPDGVTWLHTFFNTQFWDTPGGVFSTTPTVSTSVGIQTKRYTWPNTPNLVADIQRWLDNPNINYGWLLLGDESTPGNSRRFDSRENPTPANHPILTIAYTPPQPKLSLIKSVSDDQPTYHQVISYYFTIANNSPITATDVTLTDTLSDNLLLAGPITITPPQAGTWGTITLPPTLLSGFTLTPYSLITVTMPITVNVAPPTEPNSIITILNTATLSSPTISTAITAWASIDLHGTSNLPNAVVYLPLILKSTN